MMKPGSKAAPSLTSCTEWDVECCSVIILIQVVIKVNYRTVEGDWSAWVGLQAGLQISFETERDETIGSFSGLCMKLSIIGAW